MRHYYRKTSAIRLVQFTTRARTRRFLLYEGDEAVLQPASTEIILKQILKTFSIYALRRKLFQGIPVIGMAIGSTVNYRLTRNVTEFANRFYQVRHIVEKEKSIKARGRGLSLLICCMLFGHWNRYWLLFFCFLCFG